MRVSDHDLTRLREQGFAIIEGFLSPDEVATARAALWKVHPEPSAFFADPHAHPGYLGSQFAGNRVGPWEHWDLNRLTFHPDLVDLAERFLGTTDLHLYKMELWAKYAGAAEYDQQHHRDFTNHTVVVPDRRHPTTNLTTFTLLSDVSIDDGPTRVVPLSASEHIPYWPPHQPAGAFADEEVPVVGPAGTLFAYRTDVFHRGSAITGERSSRFIMGADYRAWDLHWTGKLSWPDQVYKPGWTEMIERATPRERQLFGFPAPDDPFWTDQTRRDTQARYPKMDITPYVGAST